MTCSWGREIGYLDGGADDHVGGVLDALVSEADDRRVALVRHLLQLRVDLLQTRGQGQQKATI